MKASKSIVAAASAILAISATAGPGKPNFGPGLWADGRTWGSKGTTELPAPNGHNIQSYDPLFVIINSNNPDGQLPVAEAGPGNVAFNGGRWITYTAWWTGDGFAAYGTVPVITSYAELLVYYMYGYLDFEVGSPENGPPPYFQCPMLPVKE